MSLVEQSGSLPVTASSHTAAQPTLGSISASLDLLISLTLHTWPALTLAIQNAWGGSPQLSADKRDWFAGAISELLTTHQVSHLDDLEEVLLQVMLDEFEVVVDDDSAFDVAQKIWKGREKVLKGEFGEVQEMYERWRRSGGGKVLAVQGKEDEDGQDTDWDEEDDDEAEWNGIEDADGDQEMDDAPALVEKSQAQKAAPEIDEDGFTKVVGKKRR